MSAESLTEEIVRDLGGIFCKCDHPAKLGPAGVCPECGQEGPFYRQALERHEEQKRRGTAISAADGTRRLILTPASAIKPRPVRWAWEDEGSGRIPSGSFGLLAGREGTGKSSFLLWLVAMITKGWLPGIFSGVPRKVIYVAVEDSWQYTIVPRLIAAGADMNMVFRCEVQEIDADATTVVSLPQDIGLLGQAITENDIAMVAIDPLMSAISDSLDTHVDRKVRVALDPLAQMADRTGCVVAGIAHFNKSPGTDASSLITGSGAFKNVARFIFGFAVNEDEKTKVITQTKNSLGHEDLPSLAYRIEEATIITEEGPAKVGRLVLEGESHETVRDVLATQHANRLSKLDQAKLFLSGILADGPVQTTEVLKAAERQGVKTKTVERARSELNIVSEKSGPVWWMALPHHAGDIADAYANSAMSANPLSPDVFDGHGGLDSPVTVNSANSANSGT